MKLDDLQFSSSQAASAAGMSHGNFRTYLSRGHWRMVGAPAEANGFGHKFGIFDVLAFALARQLVDHGVDPKEAFERAILDFAHTGDEDREPGGVYPVDRFGATLYVHSTEIDTGRCVGSKTITDALDLLPVVRTGRVESAVVINLNALRDRVFAALGLDARDHE